jgi:hypothetical protein
LMFFDLDVVAGRHLFLLVLLPQLIALATPFVCQGYLTKRLAYTIV